MNINRTKRFPLTFIHLLRWKCPVVNTVPRPALRWAQASIALCLCCNLISCFKLLLLWFPIMEDHTLEMNQNKPSPVLFRLGYVATATGKIAKVPLLSQTWYMLHNLAIWLLVLHVFILGNSLPILDINSLPRKNFY